MSKHPFLLVGFELLALLLNLSQLLFSLFYLPMDIVSLSLALSPNLLYLLQLKILEQLLLPLLVKVKYVSLGLLLNQERPLKLLDCLYILPTFCSDLVVAFEFFFDKHLPCFVNSFECFLFHKFIGLALKLYFALRLHSFK